MSWREKVTLLICSPLGYIISKQDGEVPKMAKTEMIRARVEPELKSQAEEVSSGSVCRQPQRSRCSIAR